jgi:hypothetical protein
MRGTMEEIDMLQIKFRSRFVYEDKVRSKTSRSKQYHHKSKGGELHERSKIKH